LSQIEYFYYSNMIETLISSKTRIKLLLKFFLNSKNTAYLRNLEDEFGESTNAIRIELNKFEKAGFLESFAEGNKKLFTVNTKHPLFKDINRIIMKMVGLEYVVDYVLQRIGDLEKVYLVGNMSKGQATEIIDLVLVGDNLNKTFLIEQIEKAEKKIDKKIRYVHYGLNEFDLSKIKEPGMHPLLIWSK
jgi:predicted transcriptional regulator